MSMNTLDHGKRTRSATEEDFDRVMEIDRLSFSAPWSHNFFKSSLFYLRRCSNLLHISLSPNAGKAISGQIFHACNGLTDGKNSIGLPATPNRLTPKAYSRINLGFLDNPKISDHSPNEGMTA